MSVKPTKEDEELPNGSSLKKPYKTPALVPWGTLRDITQTVGEKGSSDGGRGGDDDRNKTRR